MLRTALAADIPFIQSVLNAPDNLSKLAEYSDETLAAAVRATLLA